MYEIEDTDITASKNEALEFKVTEEIEDCIGLISGLASITATVSRMRRGRLPLEPLPELSHAGNFLYLATGRKPTALEEKIMDVCLILHADHGLNASTFAAMVVASTLADLYFAVGTGIAALSGPLHGGANEQALRMLIEIGGPERVKPWLEQALAQKRKIMGVGHRVYKAYDPRARVLSALADHLAKEKPEIALLYQTARSLEKEICTTLGKEKRVFPNVDFYSGLIYRALGMEPEIFTPIFAVSRVAGWTARVLEYLENNRIFRPRVVYTGEFGKTLARR